MSNQLMDLERYNFIYKDLDSDFYDLLVTKGDTYVPSVAEYEKISVLGRNGSLIRDKGTYQDREITLTTLLLINPYEVYDKDFISWLTDTDTDKENKLFYEYYDKYYLVKKVDVTETKYSDVGIEYVIKFLCEPFLYGKDKKFILNATETEKTLLYDGNAPADTNIRIYGSGNIQLEIDDMLVTVENVDEFVDLDSRLMMCTDKLGANKSIDMIGDFPTLTKARNKVSFIGNVEKIEIKYKDTYL